MVTLVGNVVWFPNEFLRLKCPQMGKALDKKALQTVLQHRQSWLQQRTQTLTKSVLYSLPKSV